MRATAYYSVRSRAAKLELIGAYESGVKAALYYLHDAEDQRRVRLSEADALNRATAVGALRMLRRLQEDPYVRPRPAAFVHSWPTWGVLCPLSPSLFQAGRMDRLVPTSRRARRRAHD